MTPPIPPQVPAVPATAPQIAIGFNGHAVILKVSDGVHAVEVMFQTDAHAVLTLTGVIQAIVANKIKATDSRVWSPN